MMTGSASVILFKFVVSNMEGIGPYFVELDVLAPSFSLAMLVGFIVSKMYPPTKVYEEFSYVRSRMNPGAISPTLSKKK